MQKINLILIVLLILILISISKCEEENNNDNILNEKKEFELKTIFGTYIGTIDENSVVFKGIRFAQPPVGDRRFKVPLPYEYPRDEVINATEFGSKCVQMTSMVLAENEFSEDCLFLNIWAPLSAMKTRKRLPVLFFIHGGTFLVGSGSDSFIDGKQYNENGVILVTINYRLGILGFLTYPYLNEKVNGANGNLGVFDQREALFWVNKHISAFRGDPNNVLIFGESAGAASTLYHLISKNSNGKGSKLFHKAIIQSTIDESLISAPCQNLAYASELYVKKINCYYEDSLEKSIDCLMNKPVDEIVQSVGTLYDMRKLFWHADHDICPCFDDHVFTATALRQIEHGLFDFDVPVIIGTTLDEGTMFALISFPFMGIDYDFFNEMISSIFKKQDLPKIKEFYSPAKFPDATDAISDLLGDFYFQCFARKVAVEMTAKRGRGKVYKYLFAKRSESGNQNLGVFHSSELPYSFHTTPGDYLYPSYFTPIENEISLEIIRSYTNFAKTGNPNIPDPLPIFWPSYDKNSSIYVINDNRSVISDFKKEVCSFWDENYTGKLVKESLNIMEKEPMIPSIVNKHGFTVIRNLRKIIYTLVISLLLVIFLFVVKKLY